ncbi:alpha/beta hydrolase [Nonomuraea sp. NPDC049158]|uniref:alpha/beta hydrolase n=1 Tax=Nonomuraea sp. NPDC049158 TaxID=3155649 RepID=UPI0034077793
MKRSMVVAPELRPLLRRLPLVPVDRAWARRLVRYVGRRLPTVDTPGVAREDPSAPVPGTRLYRPETRRGDGALLWIHGGGYVIGNVSMDDGLCGSTARELGVPVLSVEYRLAPEHPFPAALDDCHAGWAWLQEHARSLGFDPARVAVGGQSAGGGLAAPYAVPARRADLGGLPPTWIGVGDIDLFHDEDRDYADRLRAAGVTTTFDVVPGAPHGFETWASRTAIARQHIAVAHDWLRQRLISVA